MNYSFHVGQLNNGKRETNNEVSVDRNQLYDHVHDPLSI